MMAVCSCAGQDVNPPLQHATWCALWTAPSWKDKLPPKEPPKFVVERIGVGKWPT